jgi:hypothetical protein
MLPKAHCVLVPVSNANDLSVLILIEPSPQLNQFY